MNITRDPELINKVLNTEGIREGHIVPGVDPEEPIIATPAIVRGGFAYYEEDKALFLFDPLAAGVYEVHSSVYPEWRKKSVALAREARDKLFIETDATELVTRVHEDAHRGVRWLAIKNGMRPLFERDGFEFLSLDILQWSGRARRYRADGEKFHEDLERISVETNHDEDKNHDQYVGIALASARSGNIEKGVWLYNQWARLANFAQVSLYSRLPPVVEFDGKKILILPDSVEEI